MKRSSVLCTVSAALAFVSSAGADVAFNNFGAGDTFDGSGWIVFGPSSAAWWTQGFQFTATASGGVTNLVVPIQWLDNQNDFSLELRADAGGTPGAVLGSFAHFTGNLGTFDPPVQIAADGTVQVAAGTTYWLVAQAYGSTQGTWHGNSLAQEGLRAFSFDGGATWTTGAVNLGAFRVEVAGGPAPCYPNCDGSTNAPILNVLDFNCFINRYTAGETYANCDGSTIPPVLNVLDFNCFLNRFTAGCP